MNETEAKALEWICQEYKVNACDVKYSGNASPDFQLPNGVGFEVKKVPTSDSRSIHFELRQWESLQKQKNIIVLVFSEFDVPDAIIPLDEFDPKTRDWGDYYAVTTPSDGKHIVRKKEMPVTNEEMFQLRLKGMSHAKIAKLSTEQGRPVSRQRVKEIVDEFPAVSKVYVVKGVESSPNGDRGGLKGIFDKIVLRVKKFV